MKFIISFLMAGVAMPALGATLSGESRVTEVTLFPQGARVTRELTVTIPEAGLHDLRLADLPGLTDAGSLRLIGSRFGAGTLDLGGISLRDGRLHGVKPRESEAQRAAKARLDAAAASEREANAALELQQVELQAAEAELAFLTSFAGALPDGISAEGLRAMVAEVGAGTAEAGRRAVAARTGLWPLEEALREASEARERAEADLAAQPGQDRDPRELGMAIEASAAGEAVIELQHFVDAAGWRPTYVMDLARVGADNGAGRVRLQRDVLISQATGEDWTQASLTLSTQRPSGQLAASQLWPERRALVARQKMRSVEARMPAPAAISADAAGAPIFEMAMRGAGMAQTELQGVSVVYRYPGKVQVMSGVEDLRLSLDSLEFEADVHALAVPRRDSTAFIEAIFRNQGAEPILPGEVELQREGSMIGRSEVALIVPGAEVKQGFGALETLHLRRDMPNRDQGESGLFTTTSHAREAAVLHIENRGAEAWPVRVLDLMPYSEQEALQISSKLSPEPSLRDPDGKRGLLQWDLELAPGAVQEIEVSHEMRWPEEMVLE